MKEVIRWPSLPMRGISAISNGVWINGTARPHRTGFWCLHRQCLYSLQIFRFSNPADVVDRGLPSHLGVWPNRGVKDGERSTAFLHHSVRGQNKRVKGARPSFTSRFVAKTEG